MDIIDLTFPVKQQLMREQVKYKYLLIAALRHRQALKGPPFLTPDGATCHSPPAMARRS
jgi:hypothetical protein